MNQHRSTIIASAWMVATFLGNLYAADVAGTTASGSTRTSGRITLTDTVGGIAGGQAGGRVSLAGGTQPAVQGISVPVVTSQVLSISEDATTSGVFVGKDPDGDPLTYKVLTGPGKGSLALTTAGAFTYTPKSHFVGTEIMSVVADDGRGNRSAPARLTVTVKAAVGGDNPIGSTGLPLRAYMLDTPAPYALNVGDAAVVVVLNGSPSYTWVASNAGIAKIGDLAKDVDGDGKVDTGIVLRLTTQAAGTGSLVIRDTAGINVGFTFTAVAPPPPEKAAEVPPVAQSSREVTVFSTIGGQTQEGCRSVINVFRGVTSTQAVGWVFDPRIQDFVGLPAEPEGGLTPDHGIFIATRVTLPMNFAGAPVKLPHSWGLPPGWSLIAIPLLADKDGNRIETSGLADFTLGDATGDSVTDSALSDAYSWNGSDYTVATTFKAGQAYWIRNATDAPVIMKRGDSTAKTAKAKAFTSRRADDGLRPPLPPGFGRSGLSDLGGGCGAGGIGVVILLMGLAFRRTRR